MPTPSSFEHAVFRVVPRVEREEFVNAGVIVYCRERDFLAARVEPDDRRLRALWPSADLALIRRHLASIPEVCAGSPAAGPIARLSQRERFQWLTAPRSTIIQVSPVHAGLCDDPRHALDELYREQVEVPVAAELPTGED